MEKKVYKKDKEHPFYAKDTTTLLKDFDSSLEGLSHNDAQKRLESSGKNSFIKEDKYRLLKILLSNFNNILMYVLFAAALISFVTNEMVEFYVIMGIIILTIALSFFQQYSADKTVNALKKLRPNDVFVLRDNKKITIDPEELVPGDIVLLKRGDLIPADMRVIEEGGLSIDESILTGESISKSKTANTISKTSLPLASRDNMLYASTSVTSGTGKALVIATGFNTEIGKLSLDVQEAGQEKSPLQKKIDDMSKQITFIIVGICILLFGLLLYNSVELSYALLIISAVAVAGIPESFPLALTLALSKGVKTMATKNALLKNLNSVETLGNTTVICTDKTGTLTENKMKISKVFLGLKREFEIEGTPYIPEYTIKEHGSTVEFSKHQENFFLSSILCNDSLLYNDDGQWKLDGEPTEGAFIALAQSQNYDEVEIRKSHKKISEIPFTPEKKYMVTLHEIPNKKQLRASIKGAAERVVEKCTHYVNEKEKVVTLTPKLKQHYLELIESQTSQGFRVMAVGSKHTNHRDHKADKNHLEHSFTLEGIVCIKDPIRPEVFDAVKECRAAGISLVMITGDHKLTATSIAKELGIISNNHDIAITGEELSELSDKELDFKISDIKVFSRVTPKDKMRIISSFQRKGEIVAMTGDGVNDAPALKKSDIGISMGKNGTEVAREASDMILLDDNFATIVSAVKEGRTIYDNIQRFIYYLLTTNFAQVGIIFLAVMLGFVYSMPLSAIMILFINIVTSTFPALALSIEPTKSNIMSYIPRNPKEKLLSKYIFTKIMVIFPIMMFSALLLFLWELQIQQSSLEKAMTVAFLVMVLSGLFHTFNARELHQSIFSGKFFENRYIFYSVGFSLILTILTIGTQSGREIFGLSTLGLYDIAMVIVFSVLIVVFAEILKFSIKMEVEEQTSLRGLKNYLK